jgi:ribokinase
VPESLLRRARIVLAQHEANLALNAHGFRVARRLGAKTVLNPAPMRPDFNASILHDVDVLIPNENEFVTLAQQLPACSSLIRKPPFNVGGSFTAATLSQVPAPAMQQLCRAFGVPVLIVTLGKRGCFVSLPDRCEHVPAHVVEVVDSTGAGDAFVGGFAAGWIKFEGNALLAARYANAVAALSVTKFGTARSMPRHAEIERFLRQQTKSQRPAKSSSRKQKPARSI